MSPTPTDGQRPACGCGGSPSRQAGCEGFKCLWLMGVGERGDRPDQLGVLLAPVHDERGRVGVLATEIRPGGARTERVVAIVELLRKRVTVLLAEHAVVAPGIGVTLVTELEPERAGPIRERARTTLPDRASRRRGARR